jgi:hypothetical protein
VDHEQGDRADLSIGQAVSSSPVPQQRPDLLDAAERAERPFGSGSHAPLTTADAAQLGGQARVLSDFLHHSA